MLHGNGKYWICLCLITGEHQKPLFPAFKAESSSLWLHSYIRSSVLVSKGELDFLCKRIDSFYSYCSAKKRPFQVSERHNNGFVDVAVRRFLYAHPPSASVYQSISEHCYLCLWFEAMLLTPNSWYKRANLLRITRTATEAKLFSFIVHISLLSSQVQ